MSDLLIASDHAGFELKEKLVDWFVQDQTLLKSYHMIDLGPFDATSVDYPDFAEDLATQVSRGTVPKGILICGSGIGMCIVANKFPNVRSSVATNEETAMLSAKHNSVNILCLGARTTSLEDTKKIILTWLNHSCTEERHKNRVNKIKLIEDKLFKRSTPC